MGQAEIISLSEMRASKQWAALRRQLHDRFDQWLDRLEAQLPEPETTLAHLTETVWDLRQELTGGLTETLVDHAHQIELTRKELICATCDRLLAARPAVSRTVDTMVGSVQLERPYFYCRHCQQGTSPLDEALDLTPGRKQLDVQQAAARVVVDTPYGEAQTLFRDLTGVRIGSERMHTLTNQAAEGLTVLDVAPSREDIERRVAEVAAGQWRRPVVVLGIDGAYAPTRPDSARGRRPGQGRYRAKRPRWKGQWRETKGFRFYLLDGDRIVQLLSWHQVQSEAQVGQALKQVKEAGLIPEEQVRLCVVGDGASWIWKYIHCAEYLHKVAKAHYGTSVQALQWVEATLTRLYLGQVGAVLGGLRRMQAHSEEAAKAIANCWVYLHEHRNRTSYRQLRKGGYPLGSGGIESSNKFICHVRLKRSGAWWYELNSNQMLALRCAKYNGTFNRVFERYRQRLREA